MMVLLLSLPSKDWFTPSLLKLNGHLNFVLENVMAGRRRKFIHMEMEDDE